MAIKQYAEEELDKMKSMTDLDRVKNMKDEDIDTSDPDAPDVAELLEKGLAYRIGRNKDLNSKRFLTIPVEADIIQNLCALGDGWQTRLIKQISEWAKPSND